MSGISFRASRAEMFAAVLLCLAILTPGARAAPTTISGQDCGGQDLICDGVTIGCGGVVCNGSSPDNTILTGVFTNVGLFSVPEGEVIYVFGGQPLTIYASTIDVEGVIDATGAGGFGGTGGPGSPTGAGTNGYGPSPGGGGPYGGAGGAVSGGGGGGYGGAGGAGSVHPGSPDTPAQGGSAYGNAGLDSTPLTTGSVSMGSGGGGGTGQDIPVPSVCPGSPHDGGSGGNGGGVVYLEASSVTVKGAILANGDSGNDGVNATTCTWSDSSGPGAGGGGSGGGILIRALNGLTLGANGAPIQGLQAGGGNGGGGDGYSAYGAGGGAGGRVKLFSGGPPSLGISISTGEGAGGLPAFGDVNNSTGVAGSSGTVFFGLLASSPTGVGYSSVGQTSIQWNWNATSFWGDAYTLDPSSTNVSYKLYSSTTLYSSGIYYYIADRNPQLSVSSATIQATETGLSPNTLYSRYVTAYTEYGDSFPSASTSVYTLAYPPVLNSPNPFSNVTVASFELDWSAAGNPSGTNYVALVSTMPTFSPLLYASSTVNTYAVFTSTLAANVQYFAKVEAFNGGGVLAGVAGPASTSTLANTPVSVGFSPVYYTSATVAWSQSNNSPGTPFTVEISTDFFADIFSTAAASVSSATFTGLSPGTQYYARVKATNNNGIDTAYSSIAEAGTLVEGPAAVSPAFTAIGSATLTANWGSNGNPSDIYYQVQRSTDSSFSSMVSMSYENSLSSSPLGLSPNATYYFRVATQPPAWLVLGGTATLTADQVSPVFTFVSANSLTFGWGSGFPQANPSGTTYQSEISEDGFVSIAGFGPTTGLSANYAALFQNTTYYARVKGINWDGESGDYSPIISTVTDAGPPVTNLGGSFSAVSTYSITAGWSSADGNPGGTLYELDWSTASDFTGTVSSEGVTERSYEAAGLGLNTTYYFQVRAFNILGVPTTFTNLGGIATLVNRPVNVTSPFSAVGQTSFTFSWGANGNPSGTFYDAELSTDGFVTVSQDSYTANTFATLVSLATNTVYAANVYAYNVGGLASDQHSHNLSTSTLATLPANVSDAFSNLSAEGFTFTWDPGGNPGGTDFVVQIATLPDFSVLAASAATLAFSEVFSGLDANTTYYAEVEALSHDGVASGFAPSTAAVTLTLVPGLTAQPFSVVEPSSFTFSWSLNGNPAGTLFAAAVSNDGFATIASSAQVDAVSYVFTGLLPNTTYEARVAGINGAGVEGSYAGPASTATLAFIPQSASPAIAPSGSGVSLDWLAGSDPTGTDYGAEISTDPAFGTLTASAATTALSQSFPGLVANATYYGQVQAINYDGVPTAWLSAGSTATFAAALSSATSVTASTAAGVVGVATITFTNNVSTGTGGLSFYRWVFDTDASHSWTDLESTWTPAGLGALLYTTATTNGYWYLHLKSYNFAGAGTYSTDVGPYDVRVSSVLPPSNIAAASGLYGSGSSLEWTWDAAVSFGGASISSYVVAVATSPSGFSAPVATGSVAGVQTNYSFGSPQNGQTYYLSVYAIDEGGVLSATAYASQGVLMDQNPPSAPGTPQPNVDFSYNGSIMYLWSPSTDAVVGIKGYYFDLGTSPGASDVLSAVNVGTATFYNATSLASNKTYYARVKASNNANVQSEYSLVSPGVPVWIASSASAIKAMGWPNPFNPKSGPAQIGFYLPQAPASVSLKIYTLEGRLVYEQSNDMSSAGNQVLTWSGRNGSGETVAPGGYIVVIDKNSSGSAQQETFKIAVLY